MPNRLALEKSPYLRQHADNPVDWYAWGHEAFEKARRENKPIFLSIGYSTCHWCHVMAHESFENQEVADLLAAHFVSIKVDREERPDVDSVYMGAVQAMASRGGWPLTAFLTPDLKPFFGATYFPRAQFLQLLEQLSRLWKSDPQKAQDAGESLFQWLKDNQREAANEIPDGGLFDLYLQQALTSFDHQKGGKKGAPKFAPSYDLRMMMRIQDRRPQEGLQFMIQRSLDAMARGGLYDHLGGGFHRYSTDEDWLVPHFEKMLYDQAAMSHLYLDAWQLFRNPEYARVLTETLDYVLRDLRHPEGAFFAAEDADSEGEEGTFYVWGAAELRALLKPEELNELTAAYGVLEAGNFEGKNILNLQPGFTRHQRPPSLEKTFEKLRAVRAKRIRPHRDEKILCSWNGLMISAFARAGLALRRADYQLAAQNAADYLWRRHGGANQLLRSSVNGEAQIPALGEDYAFFIHGLLDIVAAGGDAIYLERAAQLQQAQDALFWDEEKKGYFVSRHGDNSLLFREKDFFDNVIPNLNSISALNLLRLGHYQQDASFHERCQELFRAAPREWSHIPLAFPQLSMALDLSKRAQELVIVAGTSSSEPFALREGFWPHLITAFANSSATLAMVAGKKAIESQTTYYLCEWGRCLSPTTDVDELKRRLREK